MSSLDDSQPKKQTTSDSFERTFQSIQLDITNVKAIGLLSDKSKSIDSFKKLLKPSIEIVISSLISCLFNGNTNQLTMELRHDFIIIDSDYKPISDIVPNIKKMFKDCDSETDQRLGQYIKTCQIKLSDFENIKSEYYYFFFLINRDVFPFKLFFLGCKYVDISEDTHDILYIDNLTRSNKDKQNSTIISKKKKDEKKYRDKLTFVDTTDFISKKIN